MLVSFVSVVRYGRRGNGNANTGYETPAMQSVHTQVRAEIKGPVGYLIFDRPERKNALSFEMWKEAARLVNEMGANRSLRVVVLRGAGDLPFCSGADISEFETMLATLTVTMFIMAQQQFQQLSLYVFYAHVL